MLDITIYDVQEHEITNEQVRKELNNCYTIEQAMELRRARWLEKITNMDETRGPRKMLVAWTPQARSAGRPKQSL